MCIAVILAAVSSLYSRPQLAYIDFDVLAILLSLMLVVAELKEIRFLDWLAVELLNKCRSKRQLELVLGMTGSCALLLLISVLSSVAAVVP